MPTLHRDDGLAEGGRGLRLAHAYSRAWGGYQSVTHTVTWFECAPESPP